MWKEAAAPSCTAPSCTAPSRMPSGTAYRGAMNGRTVPSHATAAVPSHATAAVPTAAASRQRRRSDRCSADCDRRCETSQFRLTRRCTHGVLPRYGRPNAMRYVQNCLFRARRIKFCDRRNGARRSRYEQQFMYADRAFARSGISNALRLRRARKFFAPLRCGADAAVPNSRRGASRSRCRSKCYRRRSSGRRRSRRAAGHSRSRFAPCDRPSPRWRRSPPLRRKSGS
jgi:hypothetical protein